MRLDKFLADAGVGTRSQVKAFIKKGLVTVNGNRAKDCSAHINEKSDSICFQDKPLSCRKDRYYMLNKPMGVVCATKDNANRTVLDLFDQELKKGLIVVGRLDKDTEGLLFLTTDGEFSHRLMSPKKHVEKTYYFEATGELNPEKIEKLETGIAIADDEPITRPAKVSFVTCKKGMVSGHLTITEGRYHQVKRMLKAVGCHVTYLKRLSIGEVLLDEGLLPGAYRELLPSELQILGGYT